MLSDLVCFPAPSTEHWAQNKEDIHNILAEEGNGPPHFHCHGFLPHRLPCGVLYVTTVFLPGFLFLFHFFAHLLITCATFPHSFFL